MNTSMGIMSYENHICFQKFKLRRELTSPISLCGNAAPTLGTHIVEKRTIAVHEVSAFGSEE